jgi:glycosyltransferase involved in cell wall biosynthesis
MRLFFIADGRSPTALNWIEYFVERGHEVHLVSTFACKPDLKLASLSIVPVAFSGFVGEKKVNDGISSLQRILYGTNTIRLRTRIKQWFGPLTLSRTARELDHLTLQVKPDLVHAMRIPYEGMAAALLYRRNDDRRNLRKSSLPPLIVSVWGNDFTLHAPSTPIMKRYTHLVLDRADGLHTDCQRDLRLAHNLGYSKDKPAVVLPGGGGVRTEIFFSKMNSNSKFLNLEHNKYQERLFVINPRGFRSYIRNDAYFQAIPEVLERFPDVKFICPAMADSDQARMWVDRLGITPSVDLLTKVSRREMADLFRKSVISVSPSTHDGTPNTLLEAMACGCFPIAGDIESLREWITTGVNGLLVDPTNPHEIAAAILEVLGDGKLRQEAAGVNLNLIAKEAEYNQVMARAMTFYQELVD